MAFHIKAFSYSQLDYDRCLALRNQLQPDEPSSVEIWRYWDHTRSQSEDFDRLIVKGHRETLLAYGQIVSATVDHDSLDIEIHMSHENWQTEIPEALYRELIARVRPNPRSIIHTSAREDNKRQASCLSDRGYHMDMRSPVSRLDVTKFDASIFNGYLGSLNVGDLEVRQLKNHWEKDSACRDRLYHLYREVVRDIPQASGPSVPTRTDFEREEINQTFFPKGTSWLFATT